MNLSIAEIFDDLTAPSTRATRFIYKSQVPFPPIFAQVWKPLLLCQFNTA